MALRLEKPNAGLPWAGYQKLRVGRIHVYCKKCHRRYSNAPRSETDPPRAELVQTWCLKCSQGCKDLPEYYLDRRGKQIEWDEIEAHIDIVVKRRAGEV